MRAAAQIVTALLESDDIDPKAFVSNHDLFPNPKIKTSFSKITWREDGEGDPDAYDEENGYEDEEGQEIEVDEFDREEGMDVGEAAARWLRDKGALEPSSSHFHPGVWYSTIDADQDMRTGASTTRSFHLEGFTPEEEAKIFRLLVARRTGGW